MGGVHHLLAWSKFSHLFILVRCHLEHCINWENRLWELISCIAQLLLAIIFNFWIIGSCISSQIFIIVSIIIRLQCTTLKLWFDCCAHFEISACRPAFSILNEWWHKELGFLFSPWRKECNLVGDWEFDHATQITTSFFGSSSFQATIHNFAKGSNPWQLLHWKFLIPIAIYMHFTSSNSRKEEKTNAYTPTKCSIETIRGQKRRYKGQIHRWTICT